MNTELALSKESTNELTVLRDQLTIAEQRNEIMELKLALQTTQVKKASKLEDSLFSPALYDHYHGVAQMLSRTSAIPEAYKGKAGDIFVAMAMGYQLGFAVEQALQDISVINGRPSLWGDGLLALVLSHPECQGIDEQPMLDAHNAIIGYSCTVHRKGHSPHRKQFTMQEAIKAGLVDKKGDIWKKYPTRMLQMRARSLALRDKFADAMRGLRITEVEKEDLRIIEGEVIKESKAQKLTLVQPIAEQDESVAIEQDQVDIIYGLMKEMNFDDARMDKAIKYHGVNTILELNYSQANKLIFQLQKLQDKETANAV